MGWQGDTKLRRRTSCFSFCKLIIRWALPLLVMPQVHPYAPEACIHFFISLPTNRCGRSKTKDALLEGPQYHLRALAAALGAPLALLLLSRPTAAAGCYSPAFLFNVPFLALKAAALM
ncbi:hypothetical protein VYU27_006244 [Nannochloropsis oceanica]